MEPNLHQNGDAPTNPVIPQDDLKKDITSLKEDITSIRDLLQEAATIEDEPIEPTQPARHRFDEKPPQTYEELLEEAAKITEEKLTQKQSAELKKQEEENNRIAAEKKALNDKWDSELDQLEKAGKLPKIVDISDPNDEGRKARADLFKTALELGSNNLIKVWDKAVAPTRNNSSVRPKPAGAKAPVGGNTANNSNLSKSRDYREIHRPIEDVRKEYFPELY